MSPKLNIMQVLTDYLRSSFDLSAIEGKVRKLAGQAIEGVEAMAGLPTKAYDALDMLQKGQVKVGMELSSNERFSRDLRAAAGLLALIAMGTVIGACILGADDNAPRVASTDHAWWQHVHPRVDRVSACAPPGMVHGAVDALRKGA